MYLEISILKKSGPVNCGMAVFLLKFFLALRSAPCYNAETSEGGESAELLIRSGYKDTLSHRPFPGSLSNRCISGKMAFVCTFRGWKGAERRHVF